MNRREFLKAAGLAGCLLPFSGVANLAFSEEIKASGTRNPLLVVVFLRGGADGLHLLAPAADSSYVAARPPELRVLDSGENAGISLADKAGFYLHQSATGLADLYQSSQLAFIHAVGISDATRSHFVAQDLIERGVANEKMLSVDTGWLTRAMQNKNSKLDAFSATNSNVFALRGAPHVLACSDVSSGLSIPYGKQTNDFIRNFSKNGETVAHRASIATLDVMEYVDAHILKDDKNKVLPYTPSGNADYAGAGDLSKTLSSVARLARMDIGLSVACVDYGGWDTHEGQSGRFNNQVKQLSQGISAFYEDMSASNIPVNMVVMTEFGRRLRANKSGGTDHGHGACWMVLGDKLQGKKIYGNWPGLSTDKLDQGVDLAVTTDYRNVLSEVIIASKLSVENAFPNFSDYKQTPLGLFSKS